MTEDDDSNTSDHLKSASESTQQGLIGLLFGIYHLLMGISEW
jgi:hypothetical protein